MKKTNIEPFDPSKENFFDWTKRENEKTYGEYCGHKDRIAVRGEGGKLIITCRTCGASGTGNSYNIELPKTKIAKKEDDE